VAQTSRADIIGASTATGNTWNDQREQRGGHHDEPCGPTLGDRPLDRRGQPRVGGDGEA
jgi:hypothetical protein